MRSSSVRAFLNSVEGLCLIESVVRRALKALKDVDPTAADQFHTFLSLSETYLRISDACDRKLTADIKAQQSFEDLKQKLEAGFTPAEVEATMEAHFERRGWGNVDLIRTSLFTYLTEGGLKAEQANEIIAQTVPKRTAVPQRTPLTSRIRKSYAKLETVLADGADMLHEALSSSESHPDGQVVVPGTPQAQSLLDDPEGPE